jgi:hypothetical protein
MTKHGVVGPYKRGPLLNSLIALDNAVFSLYNSRKEHYSNLLGEMKKTFSQSDFSRVFYYSKEESCGCWGKFRDFLSNDPDNTIFCRYRIREKLETA